MPHDIPDICRWIWSIAETCAGPAGKAAAVPASILRVSKSSSEALRQVLEWMRQPQYGGIAEKRLAVPNHPATKLICGQVQSHVASYGDGGWEMAYVTTALVLGLSSRVLDRGTPPPLVRLGLECCTAWTRDFFETACPVVARLDAMQGRHMVAVVWSVLASNPLLGRGVEGRVYDTARLATVVVRAFLASLDTATGHANLACIRFARLTTDDNNLHAEILSGVVIDWELPFEHHLTRPTCELQGRHRVALFQECLEPAVEIPGEHSVVVREAEGDDNRASFATLARLLEKLVGMKVTIVLCQKTIHPAARLWLAERGVHSVERLSNRHVDAVRIATGATMCAGTSPDLITPSMLGELESIEEIEVGGKRYMHLKAGEKVSTIVLRHHMGHVTEEAELMMRRSLTALGAVLKDPCWAVCSGGGSTEVALAAYLRLRADLSRLTPLPPLGTLSASMADGVGEVVQVYAGVLEKWAEVVTGDRAVARRLSEANGGWEGMAPRVEDAVGAVPLLAHRWRVQGARFDSLPPVIRNPMLSAVRSGLWPTRSPPQSSPSAPATRVHGCLPPPGSVGKQGRTQVPGVLLPDPAPAPPTSPRVVKGFVNGKIKAVLSMNQEGVVVIDADDDTLPLVHSASGRMAALLGALDLVAMLIRLESIVVDLS